MVTVNGNEVAYQGYSVAEMIQALNLDRRRIVVEINEVIISQDMYDQQLLTSGDRVEVVGFVGGG